MAETSSEGILRNFLQTLAHLGWSLKKNADVRRFDGSPGWTDSDHGKSYWTALQIPGQQILAVASSPKSIAGYEKSYQRFEDLTPAHRDILIWLDAEGVKHDYVLFLDDDDAASLLDSSTEEILLHTTNQSELEERLLPVMNITSLAAGSLNAWPHKSVRNQARELACWTKYWAREIGASLGMTQNHIVPFLESLHLLRLAMLAGLRLPVSDEYFLESTRLSVSSGLVNSLQESMGILHDSYGVASVSTHHAKSDIWKSAALKEALLSMRHIGKGKFTSSVFADSFADDELQEISAKAVFNERTGRGLEDTIDLSSWQYHPVQWNVDRHGMLLMLQFFDKLVDQVIEESRSRKASLERGERPGTQLDMLMEMPSILADNQAPGIIMGQGLEIITRYKLRARLCKVVLEAKAIERFVKLGNTRPVLPELNLTVKEASPACNTPDRIPGKQNYELN